MYGFGLAYSVFTLILVLKNDRLGADDHTQRQARRKIQNRVIETAGMLKSAVSFVNIHKLNKYKKYF